MRAGELHIGNKTNPFMGNARITLFGYRQDSSIVYENAIEAGNKIMANVGLISFYGTPRNARSRILASVAPKDTVI